MSTPKLTKEQAYLAMYAFLEEEYNLTQSDDIGGLLGNMSLLPDGGTADPAIGTSWEQAIQKALRKEVDVNLNISTDQRS